jgi:hypothetical protein
VITVHAAPASSQRQRYNKRDRRNRSPDTPKNCSYPEKNCRRCATWKIINRKASARVCVFVSVSV